MSRRQKWFLWPVAALAAIVVAVLILFDWNWLKGPLEDRVSAALGREFRIAGDLDVDLSLRPRITVTDLRLANPPWASDAPMFAVPRAEAVVDLPALLQGEIRLPEVRITEPALRLETRPDGPPNWEFPSEEPAKAPRVPEIGQLQIADAAIRYLEHGSGRSITVDLSEVTGSTDSADGGIVLNAKGAVQDEALSLQLTGPPAAQLEQAAEPYPVSLSLQLGESDLAGDVELGLGQEVPTVSAALHSKQVRTTDFAWLTAGAEAAEAQLEADLGEAVAKAEQALDEAKREAGQTKTGPSDDASQTWLDFDQLPVLAADLKYSIDRLEGPELVLQDALLQAGLHDRLPTLALSGNGTFKDQPIVLDVRAGPGEEGQQAQIPYRIDAEIAAGQTRITASGAIGHPERLQGVDVEFEVRSSDATELLRQLGLPAPQLPELQVLGQLMRDGDLWQLNDAYVQVGESEISGQLSADLSRPRPFVSADLRSKRLRMADFVPVGEPGAADAGEAAASARTAPAVPLIKDGDINPEALPAIDADIELSAGYVELPEFLFDRLALDLKFRDRVAVIDTSGEGKFREQPLRFEIHAGTEDSLSHPDAPYPVDIGLQSEEIGLTAKGSVGRPLSLTGLDVDVVLEGPDLAKLGDILQLPLPATPPYHLAGKVTHQADKERWNLIALSGTVGDSDLAGDVSLELSSERPTLVADLRSKKLDFDDLGVLVGAPVDPDETASEEQRRKAAEAEAKRYLLPDEPFDVPELRAIDARVKFESESVQAKKLPLERMSLDLTLQDGTLTFKPLRFDLADGEFESIMTLDGRSDVLDGEFDLTLRNIRLNQLFSRFDLEIADIEMEQEGVGTFGGGAQLKARGNSIHALAASADGEVAIIMDGGQISALIVEAIGLDVGEALGLLITEGDAEQSTMVPMQCFVARFAVQDGVMQTDALVLETSDATITGKGQIDLGEETLALELLAHPKDPSVLTASTPVRIEGTFKEPKMDLISEELAEKSLAALALSVVLPVIGAVLPFIEQGETKDSNCARLIADAKADVPAAASEEAQ
jgi:AsmA family protein